MFPSGNSSESLQTQAGLIKDFLSGKLNPISFPIIWREYFAIFFNNRLITITFFVMFAFVYLLKQYKLLAIFLSILILVILSSFIPYGSRTLGFLWPITFLIIGYFLVGIRKALNAINFRIRLSYLTLIPLLGLFALATILNVISITSQNKAKNYNWDRQCPLKLQSKNTYFTSRESMNAFSLYGNDEKYLHFLEAEKVNDFTNEGNMLVEIKDEKLQPQPLFGIEHIIASKVTRRGTDASVQYPTNAWTVPAAAPEILLDGLSRNNPQTSKYLDCGPFQVSVINKL